MPTDPREEMRAMLQEARQDFDEDVLILMQEFWRRAQRVRDAIGEISRPQALESVRRDLNLVFSHLMERGE